MRLCLAIDLRCRGTDQRLGLPMNTIFGEEYGLCCKHGEGAASLEMGGHWVERLKAFFTWRVKRFWAEVHTVSRRLPQTNVSTVVS